MIAAASPRPLPDPRQEPPGGDSGSIDPSTARSTGLPPYRRPVLAISFVSGSFLLVPAAFIVGSGYVEAGLSSRPFVTIALLAAIATGYGASARFAFRRCAS